MLSAQSVVVDFKEWHPQLVVANSKIAISKCHSSESRLNLGSVLTSQ